MPEQAWIAPRRDVKGVVAAPSPPHPSVDAHEVPSIVGVDPVTGRVADPHRGTAVDTVNVGCGGQVRPQRPLPGQQLPGNESKRFHARAPTDGVQRTGIGTDKHLDIVSTVVRDGGSGMQRGTEGMAVLPGVAVRIVVVDIAPTQPFDVLKEVRWRHRRGTEGGGIECRVGRVQRVGGRGEARRRTGQYGVNAPHRMMRQHRRRAALRNLGAVGHRTPDAAGSRREEARSRVDRGTSIGIDNQGATLGQAVLLQVSLPARSPVGLKDAEVDVATMPQAGEVIRYGPCTREGGRCRQQLARESPASRGGGGIESPVDALPNRCKIREPTAAGTEVDHVGDNTRILAFDRWLARLAARTVREYDEVVGRCARSARRRLVVPRRVGWRPDPAQRIQGGDPQGAELHRTSGAQL